MFEVLTLSITVLCLHAPHIWCQTIRTDYPNTITCSGVHCVRILNINISVSYCPSYWTEYCVGVSILLITSDQYLHKDDYILSVIEWFSPIFSVTNQIFLYLIIYCTKSLISESFMKTCVTRAHTTYLD